tara:strand:+ start:944 stop:1159 length:216 start_codon:yes stop_codon:yes gene_type:complete
MNNINMMKAFMLLGDMGVKEVDKLSDQHVAYQEKIAFSTMRASIPDWQAPRDWDNLTNRQKLERLDKLKSL